MTKAALLLAILLISQNTLAVTMQWSPCQTITSVADYRAYDGAVYFGISPGIPGCNYGGIQRVRMVTGALGTADTLKGGIAIGLTAMATKVPVQFYYDASVIVCDVLIVAAGGHSGTCQ